MRRLEDDRYYKPTDPEMRLIGTPSSLAQKRHLGRGGPPFTKIGTLVYYRGKHVNAWLDAQTVGEVGCFD